MDTFLQMFFLQFADLVLSMPPYIFELLYEIELERNYFPFDVFFVPLYSIC